MVSNVGGIYDDVYQTQKTLDNITETALNLDTVYRSYRSALTRDIKYGSFEAPIGDDNYLHMIRSGVGIGMTAAAACSGAGTGSGPTTMTLSSNDFIDINDLFRCSISNKDSSNNRSQQC